MSIKTDIRGVWYGLRQLKESFFEIARTQYLAESVTCDSYTRRYSTETAVSSVLIPEGYTRRNLLLAFLGPGTRERIKPSLSLHSRVL